MLARYRNLLRRCRLQRGFTLMEMLIVIVIIGIMSGVTVSLITAVFDSNIRSSQYLDQQTTIEGTFGFFASHLSSAQIPVGVPTDSTHLNSLTMAGDQLMFTAQDGTCVRAFYQSGAQAVRVEIAGTCSDSIITPKRGPNQVTSTAAPCVWNTAQMCELPELANKTANPAFDSSLDLAPGAGCAATYNNTSVTYNSTDCPSTATGGFVLAAAISPSRPPQLATSPQFPSAILQAFTYLNKYHNVELNASPNTGPDLYACAPSLGTCPSGDPAGTSGTANPWYSSSSAEWNNITSVSMTAFVSPTLSSGPRVPARGYAQEFTLQQVCPPSGSTSPTVVPGTVINSGQALGRDTPAGAQSVTPSDGTNVPVQMQTSGTITYMQSPAISNIGTTPTMWLKFTGQLNLTATAAANPTIVVELHKNSPGVLQADGANPSRSSVQIPIVLSSTGTQAVTFNGQFQLPAPSAASGDFYWLQVFIKSSTAGVAYATGPSTESFQWTAVAR